MKMSLTFDGRELAAALRSLSPRVSKSIQREALRDAAEPMRSTMGRLAPREPGAPDLADNMAISNATKKDGIDGTTVGVRVGPAKGFFYGYFQEYGTVHHGAQPFARPAFDSEVQKVLPALAKRLWTAMAGRGINRPTQTSAGPVTGGPGGGAL